MYILANLIAVVPNKIDSTAYFYCRKKKCILPVQISSETSYSLIVTQQKLLYDCISNYGVISESNSPVDALIISAEVKFDSKFLDKHAIKVTKQLLSKSMQDVQRSTYK